MDKKIRAEIFSRRFSGMQHTIWGGNDKELEDDLFVDVNPMNYEVWAGKNLDICASVVGGKNKAK